MAQDLEELFRNLSVQSSDESLPPQQEVFSIYHKYADELRALRRSFLPAERAVTRDERDILIRALKHHSKAAQKIGAGVKSIVVRRQIAADGQDVTCCIVQRVDGSQEDFSVLKIYKKNHGRSFDVNRNAIHGEQKIGERFNYRANYRAPYINKNE
eukprot:TRINITY_DN24778_c0_g1_i1.p1 TRINITY_DN24778_c0_g1~~TRINITY_DN24778_c0_g1_i1.p1  ORF type:complete len:156 (+),score=23.08 TRINITY_DN24778_c0_g1_i1:90-557(+)